MWDLIINYKVVEGGWSDTRASILRVFWEAVGHFWSNGVFGVGLGWGWVVGRDTQ